MIRTTCAVAAIPVSFCLLVAATAHARTPDELPLPADQVMFMAQNPGEDIGLPLGATRYYALGRSLQQQGEAEAALLYLRRAYRLAPESGRIARTYAQSLLEAGYVQDAALVLGELVAAEPDDLEQRQQYAQLLAQAGQKRRALEQVQELRRRGERGPGLVKLEADLLAELGQIDEAVEVYREAGRRDPDRAEDYILAAALMLQRERRFPRMAELLREGLQADPVSRTMRVALVRYLVHDRRLDEAREQAALGDALRREGGHSDRPECSLELAEILARRGNYEVAAAVLGDAHEEGFRDREAEAQRGRFLLTLERLDEAREVLAAAARRWPEDAELAFLGGRALEMSGDLEAARDRLATAVALQPEMPLYRISLLRHLLVHEGDALAADDPDDAQREVQDAAREQARRLGGMVHPEDASGQLVVGTAWRVLGEYERACRHFELAAEVNESRLAALLELGYCRQLAGNLDGARETLAAAYTEYPDDPEAANSYGYFLAEQGEKLDLAERLIEQALAVEPDNGAYLDSMGWVYFMQGRYAEAFDFLVEAANQRGDDPVILEHLGRTLARLGRQPEALSMLRRALRAGGDPEVLRPLIRDLERDG